MKLISLLFTLSIATNVFADVHQQITLKGQWLVETNGKAMFDPQTSGLKLWRGKLLSISDRSAHQSQQKQLHIFEPTTGIVAADSFVINLSDDVKRGCFSSYLSKKPDYEALVVDPNNDKIFFIVTEDAHQEVLSASCQQRFGKTGSTRYPSLLVRLALKENNSLLVTHVRPIKFNASFNIGNFPNDGIEGMAFSPDNTLYLGLEKDSEGKARIFSTHITNNFWQSTDFIEVTDTQVHLPQFQKGRHPINGMDYLPAKDHPGYIVAAARNDDQLWIIDLAKEKPTKIIAMNFLAPVDISDKNCNDTGWETIDNTSLEGVAVAENKIWLVNDPWAKHYLDNVKCKSNRGNYKQLAPLLFSLPISNAWFE